MAASNAVEKLGESSTWSSNGERTYTRIFEVLTDWNDDATIALSAQDLPFIRSPYPGDALAILTTFNASVTNESTLGSVKKKLWQIDCNYTIRPTITCNDLQEQNPLNFRPIVNYIFEQAQGATDKAWQENPPGTWVQTKPVVNSAEQRFRDPVVDNETTMVIRIERNEAAYDPLIAKTFYNTVNLAQLDLLGKQYAPKTLLMREFTGTPQYKDNCSVISYFRIVYEMVFDETTWVADILDQGTMELDASSFEQKPILKQGVPITDPVLLDGVGAQVPSPITPTSAVFLPFDLKQPKDWSGLNLPT